MAQITDNMLDMICMTDRYGVINYMSPSCLTISGYHPNDLMGRNISDYIHPADAAFVTDKVQSSFRKKSRVNIEFRHLCADGKYKWVEMVGNLVYDATGNVEGVVYGTRDITDRKIAEDAFKSSEERLKILFELAPDAYYLTDLDGTILDGNRAAEKIIGYRKKELIGKNYFDLNILPRDQIKNALEALKKLREGRPSQPTEFILNHKNGKRIFVEIRSYPVTINGQSIALGIARDITDRKYAEAELRRAHSELEKKVRERTANLEEANTALRVLLRSREEDRSTMEDNMLTNVKELVLPYVDKIKNSRLDDRQRAYIDVIASNLNDILSTFARQLSSRHLKLTPTEIKVANLIKLGKTTKEIAEIDSSSMRTVEGHRNSIRKKMGLNNRKINLRTYLLAIR